MDTLTIGQRIKEIRQTQQITQAELGKRTGFTQGQISRIENGARDLKLSSLHVIATAMEVDVAAFIRGEPTAA